MYIVSGAFIRGWRDGPGVQLVLETRQNLETAMAISAADIKRLGFNTIIVDAGFFAGRYLGYDEYARIILEQAARGGLGVLLGMPQNCPASSPHCMNSRDELDAATMTSCTDGPDQRAFVDRFVGEPSLIGFDCGYENFGRPNVTSEVLASMHALTEYIRSKGKIFFDVPAAGRQERARGVFSLMTPQMNPKLYSSPAKMFAEVDTDAARFDGAEINFWHSQTLPEYGYPSGPLGTAKWHQLQYDAFVGVRPRNVTVFDYQKVIAAHDGPLQYYTPRGWLMSLMARLDDASLVFYDPLELAFSSSVMHVEPVDVRYLHNGADAVLGHGVDGGDAWVARDGGLRVPLAIDTQGGSPLISQEAGTFLAWVKAEWPAASGEPHGLLQAPCLDLGRSCLQLRIAADGALDLSLWDGRGGQVSVAVPLTGVWHTDAWNQVAATWDRAAGRLMIYLNGRRIGAGQAEWAASSALPDTLVKYNVTIGNLGDPASAQEGGLDGEIDEVRFYSRALPADQIARLYETFIRRR